MEVTLFGTGTNRSARCQWTLQEAGIEYAAIDRRDMASLEEMRRYHPLAKIPAAVIDGRALFESAAICTSIADRVPAAKLIAAPGTFARAEHDQWVAFCLTEMEAWLWNTAVNTYVLPEETRITAGFEQNEKMFKRSAAVPEAHLAQHDYLVENRFTVTDIIVGWCLNWARRQGHLEEFPALRRYVQHLLARPLCALARD